MPVNYSTASTSPNTGKQSMGYISRVTLCCLLFFSSTSVFAQADTADSGIYQFNLNDCIGFALEHHHDVVNAVLDTRNSREQVLASTGKLLPHASISGNFQDNLKLATSLLPDFSGGDPNKKVPVQLGTKYTSDVTGEITQTIFNSSYFVGLKAARVYEDLSVKSLSRTKIDTRVAVTKAYYNVLVNQENIRLAAANLAQLHKTLEDTRARYEAGINETVDVDRIQVSYNTAATQQENLKRLLNYSLQLLKFQMGMNLDDSLGLSETVQDFPPDQILPDTVNYSYQDRIEYGIQQTQVQLNQLSLKNTRLGFLPSLSAYVNYGYNYFSPKFGDLYKSGFGNSAFGLSLSFPLFTGTERLHQVNQARITLQESQNDLDYLAGQIQLDVKNSYTQYQNNLAQFRTQRKNMDLTQGIYDRINYKFEQGVSSSLDVISAESELKQAQSDYINALLNTLISKVELDKAMGKIRE
ncbi:TolC family protein [Compostibacter hankyongensis]|uniref:TolC family protein n=1 Tax=Compostibacter hankyongensis TaxID=1007089 RepID=A0ABP8G643_9BACT